MTLRPHLLSSATPTARPAGDVPTVLPRKRDAPSNLGLMKSFRQTKEIYAANVLNTARPAGDMSADHHIAFRSGSEFLGWLNQFDPAVRDEPTCTAPPCT